MSPSGSTTRLPLVGRGAELDELCEMLHRTAAGAGGCAVLTGPPGIGKTRLLEEVTRRAGELGLATAAGRASELDRVMPLTTLVSTLSRCRPEPVELGALRDQAEDRHWYVERLREALEEYAARRPLLVVLDDAQWTDEFSVLALRVLVPGLASSPVRWLLARRPVPATSAAQHAIDWLVDNGAVEMRLGPLDEESVTELCGNVLGATPDATVLLTAASGHGNPFLLEQSLSALRATGQILIRDGVATVVGDELPSGFLAAVQQRLRGLSPEALRLLRAGTVFGRPFTVHAAAQLAGGRAVDLLVAADEVTAAGLLVEQDNLLTFAHDLLRQAVYNNMSGPVRAALHWEAAAVVRAEGCSAVEVAEHLMRSGYAGDREAVRVLRTAAAQVSAHAPGTAADLVVYALRVLDGHDPARAELSADAVRLLASAGRLVEAREVGEAALHNGLDPTTEAALLLGLAEALKHAGQNAAAVQYARRALTRPCVPDPLRAQLYAIEAHALLYGDDMPGADRAGAEADRLGTASGEHAASVFGSA
ncbi:MAG TPA: AAA family ATPase, partial [Rugosimonospora sp.]|nr:AAA family ATPase [Rugosimonospora sp.]